MVNEIQEKNLTDGVQHCLLPIDVAEFIMFTILKNGCKRSVCEKLATLTISCSSYKFLREP